MSGTRRPNGCSNAAFFLIFVSASLVFTVSHAETSWKLPPLTAPAEYGNILINRTSSRAGEKPVSFSHWSHRTRYKCRVCHTELEFELKINSTEITEAKNRKGEFCGACHNGEIAFGHTKENCRKCHNGNIRAGTERFRELSHLPYSRFGNQIDWTEAAEKNLINPVTTLYNQQPRDYRFVKEVKLDPEWANFPAAVFPHGPHNYWLDCSSCHPSPFNIQKKTTKHFSMNLINEGKFCGICHTTVAFPVNNCKRCHPDLGRSQ